MITPDFHIRYKGILGMKKRDWNNNFLKPAFYEAGKFWHQWILPKHFTESGGREYGYQNRTQKYIKKKIVFKRHNDPLVYSGRLRDGALGKVRIEATFKGVRCYLPDARGANFKASPRSPNMANELRRLSQNDIRALTAVVNNFLQKFIKGGGYASKAVPTFTKRNGLIGPVQQPPRVRRTRKRKAA